MSNKLIISNFYRGHLFGFQISDDTVQRIIDLEDNTVGNIFCGYVKDVVKNINAAFVEFENKKGFLPLRKEEKICQGDKVLVQVSYEAIKSKDYGLTKQISFNGNYVVLTVGRVQISISKKIKDEEVRNSLIQLMEPYRNKEYGFILRTSSAKASSEEINIEIDKLIHAWEDVKRRFEHSAPKEVLFYQKKYELEVREFLLKIKGEVITDNENVFQDLTANNIDVNLFKEKQISLSNLYKLGKIIEDAKNCKIFMNSGAYLVFNYTEAMTVIDVNTGKADLKTDRESTFMKINQEAVKEISRQLEIRNISGIIMIDFINMKDTLEYQKLQECMQEELSKQSVPCMVMGFTRLGLMELSRKKKDKPFHEIITI